MTQRLSDEEWFETTLRCRLASGDYPGAYRLYVDAPMHLVRAGEPVLVDEVPQLILAREFEPAGELLRLAQEADSDSSPLMALALALATARQDWSTGESLFIGATAMLERDGDGPMRAQMFAFLCRSGQLERAEDFFERWILAAHDFEAVASLAAALFAETLQWQRILDLINQPLDHARIVGREFFYDSVAKAARRMGAHERVIGALERVHDGEPIPAVANFGDRLRFELALAAALRPGQPSHLGSSAPEVGGAPHRRRMKYLSDILSQPDAQPGPRQIYFCTDRNYLLGTSVSLCSLLRNNPGVGQRSRISVVCADRDAERANVILDEIGSAFGTDIELRLASAVVERSHVFQTSWGVLTAGAGLSEAAYYRIFAAQAMVGAGETGRALYLDSDTCAGPGISELLEFDLEGNPIGARVEIGTTPIVKAARKLNLDPDYYFNSGVLLFDLEHPDLPGLLARAIEVSAQESGRLTYLDQCALNVAFAGQTTHFPEHLNRYVREGSRPTLEEEETVMWHFVAAPKPWDPMYRTGNSTRWLSELKVLAQLLPSEVLHPLLEIPYEVPDAGEPRRAREQQTA